MADFKFLHIFTEGFVPLFDSSNKTKTSELTSQIKDLAAGKFHDGVKKDPDLSGKDVAAFLGMIASGLVLFRQRTQDLPALSLSLEYTSDVPCTLGLNFDRIFASPPVISAEVEGEVLMISLDLRIELKKLLPPSQLPEFQKAVSTGKTKGIIFEYSASKSTDMFGNSCRMFELSPSAYSAVLLASKKEFPKI